MGNSPSQIDAGERSRPVISKLSKEDRERILSSLYPIRDDRFESQQDIGVTELPKSIPLEDEFEMLWVIKDWSSVSQSAERIEFPEFKRGHLTNHLWSLELVINRNKKYITAFLKLKEIEGSSDFIECICSIFLYSNGRRGRKRPSPFNNNFHKVKVGGHYSWRWSWPTQVDNDVICLEFFVRIKIPLDPSLMKHSVITADPPLTSLYDTLQDFGSLLQSEEHSDLTLVVDGVEISAHKVILSARSPVFATMLSIPMKEKAESRVVIEDFLPSVVNAMLEFIYTGKTEIKEVPAEDLLLIAEKYQLSPELKNECETRLISEVATPNAIRLYLFADRVSAQRLKVSAMNYIHRNLDAVEKTEDYKEILKSDPEIISEIIPGSNPYKRVKYS